MRSAATLLSSLSLLTTILFLRAVTAQDAPRLQPFYFPKENPLLETLVISCIAIRGSQPVEFSWFKDGLPLAANKRVVTKLLADTISTLTITKIRAADIGNYTCHASNAAGTDSFSAELLVTGQEALQFRHLYPRYNLDRLFRYNALQPGSSAQ
ncbi:hypothetical protein V5799_018492 [Amblyomma americanum]|uniref:Ig-like domain-containing protein n=1 Tax=Amblyomma americanum TaxID=6943 RepID=A0AAQ4EZ43_AMBAM